MSAHICIVADCKKHAWHNSKKCATHQNTQAKTFERWVGQTVYREEKPTIGPLAGKTLGFIRGTITRLYKDNLGRDCAEVRWYNEINWYTGKPANKEVTRKGYFTWGLHTIFEFEILIRGGLLSTAYPLGCFDESQCKELIDIIPLFRKIVENPYMDVIR